MRATRGALGTDSDGRAPSILPSSPLSARVAPLTSPTQHLLRELAKVFPKDRLLADPAQLSAYASDGLTAFAVTPRAVVVPLDTDEVAAAVRLCAATGTPFTARGSGTSLSGGSVPNADGIVLAMNRMDRIVELCPRTRTAVVQPGVTNLAVSKAAAPHGLYFAPDPSSGIICTVGGNLAFNAGGVHCLKYGMTSNHVLAIRAVLADGSIAELGSASTEGAGPDLPGLFCGSEGLFGVATEATLKLVPVPERFHTVLATYPSVGAAGDAVSAVIASGMLPGALEIMDKLAMQAAEAGVGARYPPGAEAVLIVELEGTAEGVASEAETLADLLRDSGAASLHTAADESERAAIWRGRKCAFSAAGQLSPDFIVQDGVVPRSRLGEALRRIAEVGERHGIAVANVFHAGDGNLHPLIMYDGRVAGALDRAEACAADILRICIEMGGSITGEHGVGLEKRAFLPEMFSADDIDLMRRTRRAFDPGEIANRGKMFPEGEAPALRLYGLHPLEKEGIAHRM